MHEQTEAQRFTLPDLTCARARLGRNDWVCLHKLGTIPKVNVAINDSVYSFLSGHFSLICSQLLPYVIWHDHIDILYLRHTLMIATVTFSIIILESIRHIQMDK